MRNVFRKLKNSYGTTLVETLVTVVLVGLMGIATVSGIGAIQRTYKKVQKKANEQVLLSTTLIEMRNIIRYSSDYQDGRFLTKEGYWVEFVNDPEQKGIKIKYYNSPDADEDAKTERYLVSPKDGDISKVYSEFISVLPTDKKNRQFVITGLKVGDSWLLNESEDKQKYYVQAFNMRNGGDDYEE